MSPDEFFANKNVLIVSADDKICRVLCRIFKNCGANVTYEKTGHAALEVAKQGKLHVVVFSEDIQKGKATWFTHQVRGKKGVDIDVMWYIGSKNIKHFDGAIERPFKPLELVKPIYYSLKVEEDLKTVVNG